MRNCILGKKIGMTQIFNDDGSSVPVTVVQAGPCLVLQKKKSDVDSYSAIQIGFDESSKKNLAKPLVKHCEKAKSKPMKFIREWRLDTDKEVDGFELGQEIKADTFKVGDIVDVTGISKGKGFAGVMKRHNFHGAKASHGVHEFYRHPGSIGMCATPSRVFKGVKMPGRMGNGRVTMINLEIVDVQPEKNLILVKGAVPGRKMSYIIINSTKHKKVKQK